LIGVSVVRIDTYKTFQTIAGFGVTIPSHSESQASVYNQTFFDALVNDLGSIIRTLFQDTLELRDFKALKALRPDLKIVASVKSPPGTMVDGGRLKPESREAFGEHLFNLCDAFEKSGAPIYGVGFQNGPSNGSCVYDEEAYYQMFKTMCRLKAQRQSTVKLLGTEDNLYAAPTMRRILDRISADLGFCGVQGYINTSRGSLMMLQSSIPEPTLKDVFNSVYSNLKAIVGPTGKDIWVVESCYDELSWKAAAIDYSRVVTIRDPDYFGSLSTAALELAQKISSALTHGNVCSYIYGLASTVPGGEVIPEKTLCDKGAKGLKYQAVKHFFKYVLPGMVRVEASSDEVTASAFKSDKAVVAVLINDKDVILESHIDIAGANISRFSSFMSVANEFHHQESGDVVGSRISLTMLPNSITTIVGE
jgi:O-glycosyl hydrolase